ncbi:MAG: divalent metal cation transporter, partial [Verrucomicrobia bacterium]|nr:divalent metal cation transporter [Verrucomicrobiota bacterium]
FAVIPLVLFTSNRAIMGEFAIGTKTRVLAWLVSALLVSLNLWLLVETFLGAKSG